MAKKTDEKKVPHGPKVFVYGSLKRGHGNHRLLRGCEKLGRCYVEGGWEMMDLGAFPGVIQSPDSNNKMFGEVYSISTEVLAALDILEGYPHFYTRTKVKTPHGAAWMYFLNPSTDRHYADRRMDVGLWNPSPEERDWARSITNGG